MGWLAAITLEEGSHRRMKLTLPLLAFMVLLASCGRGPTFGDLAGKWKAIKPGTETADKPIIIDGQILEIESDGRFHMDGFPPLEGRVKIENGVLLFTPDKVGGKPASEMKSRDGKPLTISEPIRFRIGNSGDHLRPEKDSLNPYKFTWKRISS